MKTNKQTYEIIEFVRLFHKQIADFYDRLHNKDEKQRVKMLLDYLSQHERHREETLAKYEKEASRKIMDTWYKYIPSNITYNCLENMVIKDNMSVDDVIHLALDFNYCLIEIYKELIEETRAIKVRDVFISLLKRLQQEQKNLARDSLWLYDV